MGIEHAELKTDEKGKTKLTVDRRKTFTDYLRLGRNSGIDVNRKDADSWILVTYDVHYDNAKRNWVREKIKRMGGLWKNDSTYLVPKSVLSVEEIQEFGKHSDIDLFVVGMHVDDQEVIQTLTQAYIGKLIDDLRELEDTAKDSYKKLKIIEENVDLSEEELKEKHDVSFRGFHNRINSAVLRLETITELCRKYGNEDDSFKTELLATFINKTLKDRFERVKDAKGLNK